MIVKNKDKIYLYSKGFGVINGFSTRLAGKFASSEERLEFLQKISPKTPFFSLKQIHSSQVIEVSDLLNNQTLIEGDALVYKKQTTNLLGIYVKTADCYPVLLYDSMAKIIGAVHSGWKGSSLNIVLKTIEVFIKLGSNVKNIKAIIGPGISSCCYNIPKERAEELLVKDKNNSTYLEERKGKIYLDLKKMIFNQLIRGEISTEHIEKVDSCTYCNEKEFYSWRRDGKESNNRLLNFIVI